MSTPGDPDGSDRGGGGDDEPVVSVMAGALLGLVVLLGAGTGALLLGLLLPVVVLSAWWALGGAQEDGLDRGRVLLLLGALGALGGAEATARVLPERGRFRTGSGAAVVVLAALAGAGTWCSPLPGHGDLSPILAALAGGALAGVATLRSPGSP
jgi:hypothetical protein